MKLTREQLYFGKLSPNSSRALRTLSEVSKLTIGLPDIPELAWDSETRIPEGVNVIHDPDQDFIPEGETVVTSDTGELRRDWSRGVQTINTERTQAAQGWIGGRMITLTDVSIQMRTAKSVVAVTALDDQPIRDSSRILITTVARAVAPKGKTPFYSEPVVGRIAIAARAGLTLTALNSAGAKRIPVTRDEKARYVIPLDGKQPTHWYLLQR